VGAAGGRSSIWTSTLALPAPAESVLTCTLPPSNTSPGCSGASTNVAVEGFASSRSVSGDPPSAVARIETPVMAASELPSKTPPACLISR
jgi:hypothetical protein